MNEGLKALNIVVCVRPGEGHQGTTNLSALDLRAVDFAARLASRCGGEVRVVAVGTPQPALSALHESIARGADMAIHGMVDEPQQDGLVTARCLAAVIADLEPDLVLCGNRSEEGMHGAVPRELARLLAMSYVASVVQLELETAAGVTSAQLVQRLERGDRWVWGSTLPLVCGVEQEICAPRYLAVRRRLRAGAVQPHMVDLVPRLPEFRAQIETFGHYSVGGRTAPRIRPKKAKVATAALSASDRMKMLRGGAKAVTSGGEEDSAPTRFSGDPAAAAAEIIKLLEKKGLLTTPDEQCR